MSAAPSNLEDLQIRLRELHFTTFNGLNTIFTGGLIANLIHMAITRSARWQQQEWILALSALLVFIACWVGLARMLAMLRFAPRIWDALFSFSTAGACYALLFQIESGPQAWLRVAAVVALLGGAGTLNMVFAARRDSINQAVLQLVGSRIVRAGQARMVLAGGIFLASTLPLAPQVLNAFAVTGCFLALVADEWVWLRTLAVAFPRQKRMSKKPLVAETPLESR
jgi:hypothetical protein